MMADRGVMVAAAALGLSVLVAGGARAEQIWQGYAPRCQTAELAADPALRDPCQEQIAVFGPKGPMVLSRGQGIDVEATGSIDKAPRDGRDSRSKL